MILDNIKFREYSNKYIKAIKYTLDEIDLNQINNATIMFGNIYQNSLIN